MSSLPAAVPDPHPYPSRKSDVVDLRSLYREEFERQCRDFAATGSANEALAARSLQVDRLCLTLWDMYVSAGFHAGVALVALAGYGRQELFPYSDIDLLFLVEDDATRGAIKEPVRQICLHLWDTGLRVSPAARTLAESSRFDPSNLEAIISLLDCRFLAGDSNLFTELRSRRLPSVIAREADHILQRLTEVTQARHHKFGNTIFHMEPNLKDGPGGLRDYNLCLWINAILYSADDRRLAAAGPSSPGPSGVDCPAARDFLSAARCFLHYSQNRDDNILSWAAQEQLALAGIGSGDPVSAAEWMRLYFGHARTVFRNAAQLLRRASQRRSSLYRRFQRLRSHVSNLEFSVVNGEVYFRQAADAQSAVEVLKLFAFIARHGVELSAESERRIQQSHARLAGQMPQDHRAWEHLREILTLPHAAHALRWLHALNLLTHVVPEFEAVNLLVLRDLYHRYTVDEHTFLAIDVLHQLRNSEEAYLRPFGELLAELDHPELLFLALLLHDTGKGLEGSDHVYSSLQFAQACVQRMQLSERAQATVCSLVANHLLLSSTLRRRDIYDPATPVELCKTIANPEQLKMLTLMTLADIQAVNPEALTPWKAENLWRLYTATANCFDRSADDPAVNAGQCEQAIEKVLEMQPLRRSEILAFLDGLPQRYLLAHSAEEALQHFRMSTRLSTEPVQMLLLPRAGEYELSIVTRDRGGLFCAIAGALYAWGMDIVKATAFSNRAGVVVDNFYFKDRFRTLTLNPEERERFQRSIREILESEASLEKLLQSRLRADRRELKAKVETRIRHDNQCSARSSLLEIVTQDCPGLLHRISSALSQEDCSVEIALINTEGPLAHDVFYVTRDNRKLTPEELRDLEWILSGELSDSMPGW